MKLGKYLTYTAIICLLLLAAGCAEQSSAENSSEEASIEASRPSVSSEETVSDSESNVSQVISDIIISEPPDESSQSGTSIPNESSFVPDFSGIYRDDEEPQLEEIVIPPLEEKKFGFKQTELTIALRQTSKISYEFYPIGTTNQTLTWSSSAADVVSVAADGTLTGLRLGKAVITAVTSKGNTASCTVTVVAEIPLSPLAKTIQTYTNGNLANKSFALADVDFDGTAELVVRTYGAGGLPEITILHASTGKTLAAFTIGTDEEWGIWKRQDGSTYLLLSYTQNHSNGTVRYCLDEITFGNGSLTFSPLMARETQNGSNTYYTAQSGQLSTTDYNGYQAFRQTYFAANHQTAVLQLRWTGGTDAETIATTLQNSKS